MKNYNIADEQPSHSLNAIFKELVAYAIKAPSGHNTQPWKFRLLETAIEIHPDFTKALPVVDSDNRELYVSLGCAVENLCIAASEYGFKSLVSIKKDKSNNSYIKVDLKKGETRKDILFYEIKNRQTNRSIFHNRIIPEETIANLQNIHDHGGVRIRCYSNGSSGFENLTEFIVRGNSNQMNDTAFKEELIHWIRFNHFQTNKEKNGLTSAVMGLPSIPAFLGKPIVKSFLKPTRQNKTDLEKIHSSSHMVLFTIEQNNVECWVSLGRIHERFLLETTRLGIAKAYLNQPCEVRSIASAMEEKLKLGHEKAVLLMRLGYADTMPYSPRRTAQQVVF